MLHMRKNNQKQTNIAERRLAALPNRVAPTVRHHFDIKRFDVLDWRSNIVIKI